MRKYFFTTILALLLSFSVQAKVLKSRDFQTVFHGSRDTYSGKDGQHVVEVYSVKEWKELWRKIHAGNDDPPVCPEIDFHEYGVVAAIDQLRPTTGYSIEIRKVELFKEGLSGKEDVGVLNVEIKSIHPGRGVLKGFMISRPIHLVKFKKKLDDSDS
jgi:hypothetical protein